FCQNGTLIPVTTNQLGPISASDCLTVFCKAIGRMLVAKTQPPMLDVALDPVATYLLKLSNEEPRLLCACLASLPRLERLPTLVSLLMPSFGSTESSTVHTKHNGPMPSAVEASERGDVNSRRRLSAKRLAGRAHRQCVAGHNAWQAAYGERGRIAGPLGTVLWARVADRLGHPACVYVCLSINKSVNIHIYIILSYAAHFHPAQ
ncbi:hypothetical protein AHF37_10521, partial [Paragonimus kellicotti]